MGVTGKVGTAGKYGVGTQGGLPASSWTEMRQGQTIVSLAHAATAAKRNAGVPVNVKSLVHLLQLLASYVVEDAPTCIYILRRYTCLPT